MFAEHVQHADILKVLHSQVTVWLMYQVLQNKIALTFLSLNVIHKYYYSILINCIQDYTAYLMGFWHCCKVVGI